MFRSACRPAALLLSVAGYKTYCCRIPVHADLLIDEVSVGGEIDRWKQFRRADMLYPDLGSFLFGSPRTMPTDITETESQYELVVEIPGIDKNDIDLSADDGVLTITAEKKAKDNGTEIANIFKRHERTVGFIHRFIGLPGDADLPHSHASCKNGELTIAVPKLPKNNLAPSGEPVKIAIE